MSHDGYLLAALACVLFALLFTVVVWQWQQAETRRIQGYREWLEESRE